MKDGIGRSVKRLEDLPLLQGKGFFAADFNWHDQIFMRVVRSPVAFGRIVSIDVGAARDMEGVIAVWTHADVSDIPQIDFRMTKIQGLAPYRQWILARDYVRYVGEPVAVVFATSPYIAEDAAEQVFCEVDEGPVHLDATADPVQFMPETLPGLLTEPAVIRKSYGDVHEAFAKAHHIIELRARVGRHSGVPMETRGALGVFDEETGVVTMYGAAKVPHYNRNAIAAMLSLPADKVQLSEGHVGGGFGIRGELYPEDVLVCAAALRLRRPIKWVEDRKEHLLAANHSRDQTYDMEAAVDAQGFILGLKVVFYTDQGAYVRTHGGTVTDLSAGLFPGPYIVPTYAIEGHIRLTNKTPSGTYRAPGRYESTFARERLLDRIASDLGLSPVEVRRINLIPEDAMPFDRKIDALGTHVVYDSGKYYDLLDRLLERINYDRLRKEMSDRRAAGEKVGIGIAYFVEKSGLGPKDLVRISVDRNGEIEIVTGVASIGQGVETAMAQICAETLQVPIDRMTVIHGQTNRIEFGMGAFASRVTVMTGSAVKIAAETLVSQSLPIAAELLQAAPETITYADGVFLSSSTDATVSLAGIAGHLVESGGLRSEGMFEADHMAYPYGIHFAQVRIDAETAGVKIERYLVAYDIGKAINPMLVEGQIVGAAAQGIGGALLEEFVYDEYGQPLAASFADYLMPTCHEMPDVECLVREDAPSPINPLGVKGAGEGGITAVGAAIASAVDDALQKPGAVHALPLSPERLYRILNTL